MAYLNDQINESFSAAVTDYYNDTSNDNFVWKFNNKCDKDIEIEYPNILIRRCLFSYINERKKVKWCTPISIGTQSIVTFVISFDKLLYDDNNEYNFKNLVTTNGKKTDIPGTLTLFSGDGSIIYSTSNTTSTSTDIYDDLNITMYDRIGWYDLVFSFRVNKVCDVNGFDYFADVKGGIYSYRKNNCNKKCGNRSDSPHDKHHENNHCHKQINNKIKIKYSSYLTLSKNLPLPEP